MSTDTRPAGPALLRRVLRGHVPHLSPELRARLERDRLRRAPAAPDPRHPLRQQVPAYPSLLDQVLGSALEPDYETVARRKAHEAQHRAAGGAVAQPPAEQEAGASGPAPRRTPSLGRVGAVLVVAVFALLVVSAVRETSADAPTDALVRETLVAEAVERRTELRAVQSQVAEARRDNGALSSDLSAAREARNDAVAALRRLAATAGFQAVRGDGLRWTVQNAPGPDGALVSANELAYLVNGLWQAGAEAVAVNGQRLTARSAITQSGAGINVNGTPLTAPFAVSVIGDQRTLESLFAETRSGFLWLTAADLFGFATEVDRVDDLQLPAARESLLATCASCDPREEPRGAQPEDDGASP